jgi:DNA-binding FadR family transcriptional regulator
MALAKRYGVGRNTVRDAIAMLRAEGLIDGRQGYRSRVL